MRGRGRTLVLRTAREALLRRGQAGQGFRGRLPGSVPQITPAAGSRRTTIVGTTTSVAGPSQESTGRLHLLEPMLAHQRQLSTTTDGLAGLGPQDTYNKLLADKKINEDANQKVIVRRLDELAEKIKNYEPAPDSGPAPAASAASTSSSGGGGGFFASLFGGGSSSSSSSSGASSSPSAADPSDEFSQYTAPHGLYIWGGCGSGKSFLMDLFYDTQTHIKRKRRVHFHEWLIEVHDRLHKKTADAKADSEWSATAAKAQRESLQAGSSAGGDKKADIMEQIADDMIEEAWLFCFDEFQVTHISDAMIMKQLFSILFRKGAVVVSTSNRPPEDLYLNGLNRPLFLPFIPLLKDRCEVLDIASQTDYRLITDYAEDAFQVFFSPIDEKQRGFFDGKFHRATRDHVKENENMLVQGRKFAVPKMGENVRVALFDFKDLCDKPLGAADYISIAKQFHTVFIDNIPGLSLQERDQVRRFITLIDNFYEQRTKFVLLSEKKAHEIFTVDPSIDKKTAVQDEIFAWDRTVSRLTEMSSQDYLRERSRELELEQFWHQYDLKKYTDEEIDEIWQRFDDDLSGELDRDEMQVILREIRTFHGKKEEMSPEEYEMVWKAFDTDESGFVDKDEFRAYVKKYTLEKMPPFQISPTGSSPELKVYQQGAKHIRKQSTKDPNVTMT